MPCRGRWIDNERDLDLIILLLFYVTGLLIGLQLGVNIWIT